MRGRKLKFRKNKDKVNGPHLLFHPKQGKIWQIRKGDGFFMEEKTVEAAQQTRKKKRILLILLLIALLVLGVCLWLYFRNTSSPGGGTAENAGRRDVIVALVPSGDADESTLELMKDAASQLYTDVTAAGKRMTLLYYSGASSTSADAYQTAAVSAPDVLADELEQIRPGGGLGPALRSAKDDLTGDAETGDSVILLTDRLSADGESTEGTKNTQRLRTTDPMTRWTVRCMPRPTPPHRPPPNSRCATRCPLSVLWGDCPGVIWPLHAAF